MTFLLHTEVTAANRKKQLTSDATITEKST